MSQHKNEKKPSKEARKKVIKTLVYDIRQQARTIPTLIAKNIHNFIHGWLPW